MWIRKKMPRRKDISNGLKEANVSAHQCRKIHKTISKPFGVQCFTARKIIHKWKTFEIAVSLQSTPRSYCEMLREIHKNKPRAPSKRLQASLIMLDVKVHVSTVRRRSTEAVQFVWKGF